jgi:hypothetical protein
VPAGLLDGLQAIAAHHRDDLALAVAALATVPMPEPPLYSPRTTRLD